MATANLWEFINRKQTNKNVLEKEKRGIERFRFRYTDSGLVRVHFQKAALLFVILQITRCV